MAKLKARVIAHPLLAVIFLLVFAGVAVAAVPVFQATETPRFCTTCHEMTPYYAAWSTGAHKSVSCVACHVDAGTVNHLKHKVTAVKELWTHFSSDPRFPQGIAEVPNARCLSCHPAILSSTGPRFSHKQHATAGTCITCHSDVGHHVTLDALAKAHVLKSGLETSATPFIQSAYASTGATSSQAASETPTHIAVSCSKCHDLATVPCSKCHQPAHAPRGECATCHRPGDRWSFTHPSSEDCASCHAAPAKHFGPTCTSCHSPDVAFAKTVYTHASAACASCHAAPAGHHSGACATCHTKPGVSWAFSHPASASCSSCHAAPSGHNRVVGCASCHLQPGVSWAATHPGSSRCGSCHKAPAKHYGSTCATCHKKPGVTFAGAVYRHTSSSCSSCHQPPSGHSRAVSCTSCHKRPGVSWVASHPVSGSCSSCHQAPANHYGTSCASCHKPLVSWTSATFNHPSTGAPHSYRTFACAKCHANGYSSAYCSCHGGNPPNGD